MSKKLNSSKITAATVTALLIAAIVALIYMHDNNKSLSGLLKDARTQSEKLLSENRRIDKDLKDVNHRYMGLADRYDDLERKLNDTRNQLAGKEKELASAKNDGSKQDKLRSELEELKARKAELEGRLQAMKNDLDGSLAENTKLRSTIDDLRMENEGLQKELADANTARNNDAVRQALLTNNYRVDATRGRHEKLTVVAPKTKKITMGFDVPEEIAAKVNFSIKSPSGEVITGKQAGLTSEITEEDSDLYASLDFTGGIKSTRRVEMTYRPEKKLERGIYKIDVFNDKTYLGSCQIMLR